MGSDGFLPFIFKKKFRKETNDENCELGFGDSFSLYFQLRSHLVGGEQDLTPAKRDQIVKNRTTAGELESLLGKPYKVEKMEAARKSMFIITNMRNMSTGTPFLKATDAETRSGAAERGGDGLHLRPRLHGSDARLRRMVFRGAPEGAPFF